MRVDLVFYFVKIVCTNAAVAVQGRRFKQARVAVATKRRDRVFADKQFSLRKHKIKLRLATGRTYFRQSTESTPFRSKKIPFAFLSDEPEFTLLNDKGSFPPPIRPNNLREARLSG